MAYGRGEGRRGPAVGAACPGGWRHHRRALAGGHPLHRPPGRVPRRSRARGGHGAAARPGARPRPGAEGVGGPAPGAGRPPVVGPLQGRAARGRGSAGATTQTEAGKAEGAARGRRALRRRRRRSAGRGRSRPCHPGRASGRQRGVRGAEGVRPQGSREQGRGGRHRRAGRGGRHHVTGRARRRHLGDRAGAAQHRRVHRHRAAAAQHRGLPGPRLHRRRAHGETRCDPAARPVFPEEPT